MSVLLASDAQRDATPNKPMIDYGSSFRIEQYADVNARPPSTLRSILLLARTPQLHPSFRTLTRKLMSCCGYALPGLVLITHCTKSTLQRTSAYYFRATGLSGGETQCLPASSSRQRTTLLLFYQHHPSDLGKRRPGLQRKQIKPIQIHAGGNLMPPDINTVPRYRLSPCRKHTIHQHHNFFPQ